MTDFSNEDQVRYACWTDTSFGDWRFDRQSRELFGPAGSRRLSARPASVLSALLEADGAVVRREQLLARVWPGVTVCDDSVTQAVGELRRAFGGRDAARAVLETIPKTGYRLLITRETARSATTAQVSGNNTDICDGLREVEAYALCLEARQVVARSGDYQESVALTREAVSLAPSMAAARTEHALALAYQYLYIAAEAPVIEAAKRHAEQAIALSPDDALCHAVLGYVHAATGATRQAISAIAAAMPCSGQDSFCDYLSAVTLFMCQNYRGAAVLAERASDRDPADYRSLALAARAALTFDKTRARAAANEALVRAERALRLDPMEARAQTMRRLMLAQLDRNEEAVTGLDFAADPKSPLDFFEALTLAEIGERQAAATKLNALGAQGLLNREWLIAEPAFQLLSSESGLTDLAA
ncbi:MAG: winged helix-turn-helix domain-containing protein [Pseudomonadota bacterium]